MKTREEMIQFLAEDNEFIRNIAEEYSDEKLQEFYSYKQEREKEEKRIISNGTDTYSVYFKHDDRDKIIKYMEKENMFIIRYGEDIKYKRIGESICNGQYLTDKEGSFSMLPDVPEVYAKKIEQLFNAILYKKNHVIGENELTNFKVGDKVSALVYGSIFGASNLQGTIYKIYDDAVDVRYYRSRTKGFTIYARKPGQIKKIQKFAMV